MSITLSPGIESFYKCRTMGLWYVDKTSIIERLFYNFREAVLFTRPRRLLR